MKTRGKIGIAFLAYLVSIFVALLGVYLYVEQKDNRLLIQINREIRDIFSDRQKFVDVAYCGRKVRCEQVKIPARPTPDHLYADDMYKRIVDEWERNYQDLSAMFRLHYKRSEWACSYEPEDGWNLRILEYNSCEGLYEVWVFPYAVGYFKRNIYSGERWSSSVECAVENAFEFYTSNKKSSYYGMFEEGCVGRIWDKISSAANEYYYVSRDEKPGFNVMGNPLLDEYSLNNSYPYQNGWMYNDNYKVFLASTQPVTYSVMKHNWEPDKKDRLRLSICWVAGLSVALFSVVFLFWRTEVRRKRVLDESLYDMLKRMCSPVNFMNTKSYDKDKVDRANQIYQKLLEVEPGDAKALDDILQQAIKDLNLNFADTKKLVCLKSVVNPKNFIKPYDPQKVALANELYAILNKDNLSYTEILEVEKKSKLL